MQELLLFFMTFLFVFLIYQIFVIRRAKSRKRKVKKEPIEVLYLEKKYHFNKKDINYKKLYTVVSIVSSLDIALIVLIINIVPSYVFGIIIGFISLFLIIFISYHMVYLIYKKKGMIRNE